MKKPKLSKDAELFFRIIRDKAFKGNNISAKAALLFYPGWKTWSLSDWVREIERRFKRTAAARVLNGHTWVGINNGREVSLMTIAEIAGKERELELVLLHDPDVEPFLEVDGELASTGKRDPWTSTLSEMFDDFRNGADKITEPNLKEFAVRSIETATQYIENGGIDGLTFEQRARSLTHSVTKYLNQDKKFMKRLNRLASKVSQERAEQR